MKRTTPEIEKIQKEVVRVLAESGLCLADMEKIISKARREVKDALVESSTK